VDFDGDGTQDILAGDMKGQIWFFRNIGGKQAFELDQPVMLEAGGKKITGARAIYERYKDAKGKRRFRVKKTIPGNHKLAQKYTKIDVGDLNGDGLPDIIVGHTQPRFLVYYNQGKKGAYKYGDPEILKPPGKISSRPSPHLADWNGDGKLDIIAGGNDGKLRFFANQGTEKKPLFARGVALTAGGKEIHQGYRTAAATADWNGDGKLDLLMGNAYASKDPKTGKRLATMGNIWVYLRR
jgi:hypothetical protein